MNKNWFFSRHNPNLDFDLPLKIQFLKNFKIIVETSSIAHSIGNFIPKNIKTKKIFDKSNMWRDMVSYVILLRFPRAKK